MDEIYEIIECKIKEAGYNTDISGLYIYNVISDLIEGKENGTFVLMSKPEDEVLFEYKVDVMNDNFNLSYIAITAPEGHFYINFDE